MAKYKIILFAVVVVAFIFVLFNPYFGLITSNRAATANSTLQLTQQVNAVQNTAFTIPVMLNTNGAQVVGVDMDIRFNTQYLTVTSISYLTTTQNTTFKTYAPVLTNGTFDANKVITRANSQGILEFSAVTFDWPANQITAPFTGSTILASVTFMPKIPGTTTITLAHTPGSTIDSNVVSNENMPQDLLSSVQNSTVTITGGTGPTAVPTAIVPTAVVPTLTPIIPTAALPTVTPIIPTVTPVGASPTISSTAGPTQAACPRKPEGDANCDGNVNLIDLEIWRTEFFEETTQIRADFDGNNCVNGAGTGTIQTCLADLQIIISTMQRE